MCQRNKIMFNKRSQNFYQGHSVNWYSWTYCCTVKSAIYFPLSRSRMAESDKAMLGCLTGWWGWMQAESSPITQRHGNRPYGDGRVAGRVFWMIVTSHTSLMWCNGPWEVSCLGKSTLSSTKWSNHVLEAMWALRVPGGGSKREEKPTKALRESWALTKISLISLLSLKKKKNTFYDHCFARITAGSEEHRNPVKDSNILKLWVAF